MTTMEHNRDLNPEELNVVLDSHALGAPISEDIDLFDPCESSDDSASDTEEETNIPDFEPIGSWGSYGIYDKYWCDKYRPTIQVTKYEDFVLTEDEKNGILSDRIITSCASYLEKCPVIKQLVFCKTVLTDKNLTNIDIMRHHLFLQYVDLSWNNLEDVSALGELSFLMYLDVSYNKIQDLLNFEAPYNLTYVNYSFNLISKITDLTQFWSLKALYLSHNYITVIEGLKNLKFMEVLDLSYNLIEKIENLDYLQIFTLNLQNNKISTFDCSETSGFKTNPVLTYVRLNNNMLKSLKIFEHSAFLQSIEVEGNGIDSLLEISHLKYIGLLISINLKKNPVVLFDNYEEVCLTNILNLRFLDGVYIETKQKVKAEMALLPSNKFQASQDEMSLLALSHLTKLPHLGLNVLPADQPPRPMIILVGPACSKQEMIINKFVQKNKQHVVKLIIHTDRPRTDEDENNFYFVSCEEFNKLLKNGEFLMVYSFLNHQFGLSQAEYARGLRNTGKVMITSADMNAALAFRIRGFRPLLILAMPQSEQVHRLWLTEAFDSCVFNLRYPEAAVKVLQRNESKFSTSTSSSLETTSPSYTVSSEKTFSNDSTRKCVTEVTKTGTTNENAIASLFVSENFDESMYESSTTVNIPEKAAEENTDYDYYPFDFYVNEVSYEGSSIIFPEKLIEDFYDNILKSREMYTQFHRMNPGVFYDTIFTDQDETALKKLKQVSKDAINSFLKKSDNPDENMLKQSIIQNRLKLYETDIEQSMKKHLPYPYTYTNYEYN